MRVSNFVAEVKRSRRFEPEKVLKMFLSCMVQYFNVKCGRDQETSKSAFIACHQVACHMLLRLALMSKDAASAKSW